MAQGALGYTRIIFFIQQLNFPLVLFIPFLFLEEDFKLEKLCQFQMHSDYCLKRGFHHNHLN